MSIIKHKNGLFLYQQKSAEYMKKMQSLSYPTWETLHEDLYGFILSKYILLDDVTDVYNLTELAELSVAKTIRMPKEESRQLDGAHSCEGTTSAMNKKVLLLMALQKIFACYNSRSDRYKTDCSGSLASACSRIKKIEYYSIYRNTM